MTSIIRRILLCLLVVAASNCANPEKKTISSGNTLFKLLPAAETGIDFQNTLTPREDFDVFRYRNFYNGGGVAIGDINNDGLADVYLTSSMGDNKLFLNKGSWKFEDVTQKAGVAGTKFWSTGVSMADVNGDGFLDIYVCNSGDIHGDNRDNELFINNGDLTFTERAHEYGLADKGFSTHAAFFDFDKDGDLDCYILNNSFRPVASLGYRNLRNERDPLGGHKLYRNDGGKFVDVSKAAGIYGSIIGFGMGVMVGDINQDNWPDLYISNDFYERDYLYINNHNGTFSEKLPQFLGHLSMFSMGGDMADINNDGYPEIFSTDMLPDDDHRLKTMTAFETYDVYQLRQKNGYYHQFMRNMLHLNNRDGTFSEIGQLAGVAASDWSWGALMVDFDNDSRKEIFVCNGIGKDVTNQDFVEFLGSTKQIHDVIDGKKVNFREFVDKMPSQKLSNHLFVQDSVYHFTNQSATWGLDEPSFSNGAAYGDLDNDGDLDLIVNNVNQDAFVYRNDSRQQNKNNFVAISFKGYGSNTFGLGAVVRAYSGKEILYYENMPIRGFESSMDYKMTIGLGTKLLLDSMSITWPDDKMQTLVKVGANQHLTIDHQNAKFPLAKKNKIIVKPWLKELADTSIRHVENEFNDFDRDRLLYHMQSTLGPAFAVGDINNDGLDDFYLGGSTGHSGCVYLQSPDNTFSKLRSWDSSIRSLADEVDAVFFDADGDHDLDLYVVTGGSEFVAQSPELADVFYENKGTVLAPVFVRTDGKIPALFQSGSCVRPADIDQDGDLDLFIGTQSLPSAYGLPCDQFLLINDGKGNFKNATGDRANSFGKLGMVSDAQWFDADGDKFPDLIMVGEWMPVTIFKNDGKQLVKVENISGIGKTEGWWNRIIANDLDGDGDMDFVLGNLGLNSKFKPTPASPVSLYVNDFDQNGSIEPIFAFQKDNKDYPFALRQDIIKQVNSLKKKFVYYDDYADKPLSDIFDEKLLKEATLLHFYEPRTSVLINEKNNDFRLKPLPVEAQFSPVYGIAAADLNKDNKKDLFLGGNLFSVKPEAGRYDASFGLLLEGDGKGNFKSLNAMQSGLSITGEVRHATMLKTLNGSLLSIVRNNGSMKFFKINP